MNPNQEENSGESSGVDLSRLNPVEALEVSGEDENQLQEYPIELKRFESLRLHREEGEGQAEVRIIPSIQDPKRTSGIGEESGYNLKEEVGQSGEEENRNVLPTLTETAEHSGHGYFEKMKVRRLPKLRKIVRRKQPKKVDEELYKNVLII